MLRLNAKQAVFVAHALKLRNQLTEIIDIGGIFENDCRERTRLAPVLLVDGVEMVNSGCSRSMFA